MRKKRIAKWLRENRLDLSEGGVKISLDDSKNWVNATLPLLRDIPDLYQKFEYYSVYIAKAQMPDSRIFNHLKTLDGIAAQAEIAYEKGIVGIKNKSPAGYWYQSPVGQIGIGAAIVILGAICLHLIRTHLEIPL